MYEVVTIKVEPTTNISGQICHLHLKTNNNYDVTQLSVIQCIDVDDFHLKISYNMMDIFLNYVITKWKNGECSIGDIKIDKNAWVFSKVSNALSKPKLTESIIKLKANIYQGHFTIYGDNDTVQLSIEQKCTSRNLIPDPSTKLLI